MTELLSALAELGVVITRESGDEVWGLCPMHEQRTGRPDHKPSWSINTIKLTSHCFSCGYSGTLLDLYVDLRGEAPENLEWELAKAAVSQGVQEKQAPEQAPKEDGPPVSEWHLGRFSEVPDRLLSARRLKREAVNAFGVRFDKQTRCCVLPIRSAQGELMGYQFKQAGGVINYPEGVNKRVTLFGLSHQRDLRRVALVESPLDAVRLYGLDIPAVASFGAWVSREQVELLSMNYQQVCLALDNDKAGWEATRRLLPSLRRRGLIVTVFDYAGLEGKDPGDVPNDDDLRDAWKRTMHFGVLA